jgi:hypothetical protein
MSWAIFFQLAFTSRMRSPSVWGVVASLELPQAGA